MKLAEWARKQGISYLTAYRWFKDNKLPAEAYQSESGTIIVKDDSLEVPEQNMHEDNEAMSQFIKKTTEFSKSNSSIEDFAAYVISNFKLESNQFHQDKMLNRSRVKPTQEMTNNHFQKFLQKLPKPSPNMMLLDQDSLNEIVSNDNDPNLIEKLKKANIVECPINKSIMGSPGVATMASEMQTQLGMPTTNVVLNNGMNAGGFSRIDIQDGSVVNSTSPANSVLNNSSSTLYLEPNISSTIANANLETWKDIFGDDDSNFKIFVHPGVSVNRTLISYDKARELIDQMVKVNLLPGNDIMILDHQAKEICTWTQEAFDALSKIVNMSQKTKIGKVKKSSKKVK